MKKFLALLLCFIMVITSLISCGNTEREDNGAEIRVYISDAVYNFDPAEAYKNESALKIVSLLFDNLFVMNSDGKVEKSLAKSYKIDKTENSMFIELRTDTYWSDGNSITANDVVCAWQRLLDPANSFEAASLLFDIKNAKAAKEGTVTIDDVGISALNNTDIKIVFEDKDINYDNFLVKLTSYALVPLREDVLSRVAVTNDWAKSPSLMVTSGPFRLKEISYDPIDAKIVLERNAYYYRNFMSDAVDKSVTPYRLIIDYTMDDAAIMAMDKNTDADKKIFFVGDIPLSARSAKTLDQWKKEAKVYDALSTHMYIFNQNAEINGDKIFADARIRTALSLAIDRTAIANAVVFGEAATGIVPNGVFNTNSKKQTFRDNSTTSLVSTANKEAALAKLQEANINPSKYSFEISVPAYDEVHVAIANMVSASWCELGFKVTVKEVNLKDNEDKSLATNEKIAGVKDDIFMNELSAGNFQVAAIDYVAYSADAFTALAPFAMGYAGTATGSNNDPSFEVKPHISGYNSTAYNEKIIAADKEADLEARAKLLHEAEDILMLDLPVVPIIFNMSATIQSGEISNVPTTYYQTYTFTKVSQKNYKQYLSAN